MDVMQLVKVTVVLSLTLLVAQLVRRAAAVTRHRLWTAAFASLRRPDDSAARDRVLVERFGQLVDDGERVRTTDSTDLRRRAGVHNGHGRRRPHR
ncbi:MAG: hypothetical protein EHM55_25145 [Acidobacteria bacterium]|nr:MAG: hypothetical protein EHM55_25145 [Acidobacteriota bacterium]